MTVADPTSTSAEGPSKGLGPLHPSQHSPSALSSPCIAHVDLDAFFASVEMRLRPELRGKPVVVAYDGPRSVISTANYHARRYGIRSAQPLSQARRLAVDLQVVPPRMAAYAEVSQRVETILSAHGVIVEMAGLDEAYLVPLVEQHSTEALEQWAEQLRLTIREQLGLPMSVGIGPTKVVAKIASDSAKPDGVLVVHPADAVTFLSAQPLRSLPGVGPVTEATLHAAGITTTAELTSRRRDDIVRVLGTSGGHVWDLANNIDERPVTPNGPTTQISIEHTFDEDIDADTAPVHLDKLASELSERLAARRKSATRVTVKVRKPDMTTLSRSATYPGGISANRDLSASAGLLFDRCNWTGPVRLIGLAVGGFVDSEQLALDFDGNTSAAEMVRPSQPLPHSQDLRTPHSDQHGDAHPRDGRGATETARSSHNDAPERDHTSLLERVFWGMTLRHPTYGTGRVEGVSGTVVAIRFENSLRLIDTSVVTLLEP